MTSIHSATVSGFNEYIQTLQSKGENIQFQFARFNFGNFKINPVAHISAIGKLEDYNPANGTPLYDSVAKLITAMEPYSQDSKVLIVVMTDGEENMSSEFDQKKIFDLIKKKEKDGWTFTYLGANQDAWKAGGAMGMNTANTINFQANPTGTQNAFLAMSMMTTNFTRGADNTKLFNAKTVEDFNDDVELDLDK